MKACVEAGNGSAQVAAEAFGMTDYPGAHLLEVTDSLAEPMITKARFSFDNLAGAGTASCKAAPGDANYVVCWGPKYADAGFPVESR